MIYTTGKTKHFHNQLDQSKPSGVWNELSWEQMKMKLVLKASGSKPQGILLNWPILIPSLRKAYPIYMNMSNTHIYYTGT